MAPPPFSPLRRLFLPHRRLLSTASARAAAADPTYKSIRNLSYEDPALALDFFRRSVASGHLPSPSAYNLMLLNLASRPSSAQAHFWPFLRDMEAPGHSVDPRTSIAVLSYFRNAGLTADYASLMAHFAKAKAKGGNPVFTAAAVVRGLDLERYSKARAEELAKSLVGLNLLPLKEEAVCKVLQEVKDCPAKAMVFFLWAGRQDGYKHGSVAYNTMAKVLGSSDPLKLRELIQEMKAKGMDLEINTYRCVFKQLKGKSNMLVKAVELYELMMDGPCKPSQKDGLQLLKRVLQGATPDLVLAYRVVRKFGAVWEAKKDLFDMIYRALTINGRFDEAADLVERMKGEGHQPDNITYSNLVYGLCKANRCDEARKVFDEMEAKGCTPDLQTWTLLIQGHFVAGEVDKALQYLTEMNEKNLEADANLLDVMVKGLCSGDKAGAAHSCFVEMVDKGKFKRPWRCTYKLLIGELLRLKKLEDALGLLKSMKAHGYLGFTYSFPSLIAENGTIEDARDFLKVLRTRPSQTPPTYLMLFKAFFDKGRYSDAQDLLSECPVDIGKDQDITMLFESVKSESTA